MSDAVIAEAPPATDPKTVFEKLPIRPLPELYEKKWKHWGCLATVWIILHYSLGITGIVLAAIIPLCGKSPIAQAILSALTVICTSLVTFLGARKNANLFLQAWRALDVARLKFIHDPTFSLDKIHDAVKEREKILEEAEMES